MKKEIRFPFILAAALLADVYGLSALFLHFLGDIIGDLGGLLGLDAETAEMFGGIFRQIRGAKIVLPPWGALIVLFAVALYAMPSIVTYAGGIVRPAFRTGKFLLAPLVLLAFVVTLAGATVNSVRFGWVVKSLIDVIKAGAI